MPFVDTRLGPGTLTLGTPGADYATQVSALSLVPAVDSVDGTPTLAVPDPPPETNTTYSLDGSAINDFSSASGLQMYCYDHDGETTPFVWVSSTVAGEGATCSGDVVIRAFTIGGAVGEQLVTDFSWPVAGAKPVFTAGTAARGGEKAAAK